MIVSPSDGGSAHAFDDERACVPLDEFLRLFDGTCLRLIEDGLSNLQGLHPVMRSTAKILIDEKAPGIVLRPIRAAASHPARLFPFSPWRGRRPLTWCESVRLSLWSSRWAGITLGGG
jgi:hypothetical protein